MPFLPDGLFKIRTAMGSEKRPLSRYRLAMKLGCTEQTLTNWEHGHCVPNFKIADKIAKICHENKIQSCEIYELPSEAQDVRLIRGGERFNNNPISSVPI